MTIHLDLSDDLYEFVLSQTKKHNFKDPSEYIIYLILEDQKRVLAEEAKQKEKLKE